MKHLAPAAAAAWLLLSGAGAAQPAAEAPPRSGPGDAAASTTTLTILGTAGGPRARADKFGVGYVLTVHGRHYLVDAGEGLSHEVVAAKIPSNRIGVVFLSHLHDDHTAGLPSFMSFDYSMRGGKIQLVGPPGTQRLLAAILAYIDVSADIRRVENEKLGAPAALFAARDVAPGLVFQDDLITVTAAENTHYIVNAADFGKQQRSYAYRVQTPEKVVVFTGDTGPSPAVEELAHGADILVTEISSSRSLNALSSEFTAKDIARMAQEHLTPAQVGDLATKAKVGLVVLTHFNQVSDADLAEVRKHYSGKVVVPTDLERF